VARVIAERVVAELAAFLEEGDDPTFVALGDLKRRALPTPISRLATDPDIDTLRLYVEQAVFALRRRHGRKVSAAEANRLHKEHLAEVEEVLRGRYLRHLRAHD
jgi:hypothetical protein